MTVKALMPVRTVNLVAPLPYKGTDMHTTDTAARVQDRSGAIALIATSAHSRTRIAKLMLQRGHVVQGDMTKIYRKKG